MDMMNPDCYYGDHEWRGGSCVGCGARARCGCGAFARMEDAWWKAHYPRCPMVQAMLQQDVDEFERSLP